MSDSGGVNVSKAGLKRGIIIAAIIFCSVCIGYGLLETAKYERQANDKSREYAKYTRDKVAEACVGIARLEKVRCLNEAIDAQREYETGQQDLVAQKTSALWACIMGAAAVFGMALSALGVWLVKTTFDETRKANEIAKMAIEIENRPIMLFKGFDISPFQGNGGKFIVAAIWDNVGKQPAFVVKKTISRHYVGELEQYAVGLHDSTIPDEQTEIVRVSCQSVSPSILVDTSSMARSKGLDFEAAEALSQKSGSIATSDLPMKEVINGKMYMIATVEYQSALGHPERVTHSSVHRAAFCFDIGQEGNVTFQPIIPVGHRDEMI